MPLRCLLIRLLLLLTLLGPNAFLATAQEAEYLTRIPDPKTLGESYVSDPDHLLQPATVQELNATLGPLDQSGRAHIDVVLTRSIGEEVPKTAATALFNRWKIGDPEKNNGLLLLLVLDQRRVEFETGYGLEADLPDIICYRIQQRQMLPLLRAGRYDSAVTRGVQALIRQLEAPDSAPDGQQLAAAEGVAPSPIWNEEWMIPAVVTSIFLWPLLFVIAWFIAPADHRSYKALALGLVPLGLTAAVGVWELNVGSIWLFAGLSYLLSWGYLHWHMVLLNRRYDALPATTSRQERYQYLREKHSDLGFGAFFFPVGLFFYWLWNWRRMHQLRAAPYACTACAGTMPRLSEKQDDAFLQPGQISEEQVNSVDYDVYQCTQCRTTLTIRYQRTSTDVKQCPECRYLTLKEQEPTVEKAATTSATGWGWKQSQCAHCYHQTRKKRYTIPRKSSSSSSSGGGSSSGGSSSSSGGSSGGGGSGSSW